MIPFPGMLKYNNIVLKNSIISWQYIGLTSAATVQITSKYCYDFH